MGPFLLFIGLLLSDTLNDSCSFDAQKRVTTFRVGDEVDPDTRGDGCELDANSRPVLFLPK